MGDINQELYLDAADPPLGVSAVDLTAIVRPMPEYGITKPVTLGTLGMISVTTHRDKYPVTSSSSIGPRGFTAGHRMTAGTLVFETLHSEAFVEFSELSGRLPGVPTIFQADEYPRFDVVMTLVAEDGSTSVGTVEGITILDAGVIYSLENIAISESYSYMARDRMPLRRVRMFKDRMVEQARDLAKAAREKIEISEPMATDGAEYAAWQK